MILQIKLGGKTLELNERIWAMPYYKVLPMGSVALREMIARAELTITPHFEDESPLKLASILSGNAPGWRAYDVQKNGTQRSSLSVKLIRRVDMPKVLKHGGPVTMTTYRDYEIILDLATGDEVTLEKVFVDDAQWQASARVIMPPRRRAVGVA